MTGTTVVNIPDYLDENFIKKLLVDEYNAKELVINKFDITPATAIGENYMSNVFRIHIYFRLSPETDKIEETSLVAKCMPETGPQGPIVTEMMVYEKEAEMFTNVIPELSKLANNEYFSAKCYYASRFPERVLVFHDLKTLHYTMANRHAGLDFDHCALIMKKIAKFHAATMPYAERNMDIMKKFFHFFLMNPDLEQQNDCIRVFYEKGLETLINVAEECWTDFDPAIVAKLKKLLPVYVSKLEACITQQLEGGFKVLIHGDLWTSNMMFRYNKQSGTVEDVVFMDFQLSCYTSPGIDLNYALSICPNLETRDRTDELIEIYHQSLSDTLNSFGYPKIPMLTDVLREVKRMEFFSLVSVVSVLPLVLMEKTDSAESTFEAIVNEEVAKKARKIQYSGKLYQSVAKPMLRRLNALNLLDV